MAESLAGVGPQRGMHHPVALGENVVSRSTARMHVGGQAWAPSSPRQLTSAPALPPSSRFSRPRPSRRGAIVGRGCRAARAMTGTPNVTGVWRLAPRPPDSGHERPPRPSGQRMSLEKRPLAKQPAYSCPTTFRLAPGFASPAGGNRHCLSGQYAVSIRKVVRSGQADAEAGARQRAHRPLVPGA